MAQCNVVSGCCICCALLHIVAGLAAYYLLANAYDNDTEFNLRTATWVVYGTKEEVTLYDLSTTNAKNPLVEVYMEKKTGTDCQTVAANMTVTFECGGTLCEDLDENVKFSIACEERQNSAKTTYLKVGTFAPYLDGQTEDGYSDFWGGVYTVKASEIIMLYQNWSGQDLDEAFTAFGMLWLLALSVCGGICCAIGACSYACAGGPAPQLQPQVQMQMQQPMQQPMNQYGQPMDPYAYGAGAQPQYGQYR